MSKLAALIVILIAALATVAVCVTVVYYLFPQTVSVVQVKVSFTLDGQPLANGSPVQWGQVDRDTSYWSNLDARNDGNVNTTVILNLGPLPTGWTETWSLNNTKLTPGQTAVGILTLDVPADAASGPATLPDLYFQTVSS